MQDNNNNSEEKKDPNQNQNQMNNALMQMFSYLLIFFGINADQIRSNLQTVSAEEFCQQVVDACNRLMDNQRQQLAFNTEDWKSVITIFCATNDINANLQAEGHAINGAQFQNFALDAVGANTKEDRHTLTADYLIPLKQWAEATIQYMQIAQPKNKGNVNKLFGKKDKDDGSGDYYNPSQSNNNTFD